MCAAHTDKIILIFCEYKNHSKENTTTIICEILRHSQENFIIEFLRASTGSVHFEFGFDFLKNFVCLGFCIAFCFFTR